jgi:hypothetical protein
VTEEGDLGDGGRGSGGDENGRADNVVERELKKTLSSSFFLAGRPRLTGRTET